MQLQDQPTIYLRQSGGIVPSYRWYQNPSRLSSTRLGSLSQQRSTLLFTLYSSSQPCNWGALGPTCPATALNRRVKKLQLKWTYVGPWSNWAGGRPACQSLSGRTQTVFCTVYYGIVCMFHRGKLRREVMSEWKAGFTLGLTWPDESLTS